jgi:hypothetical protein
LRVVSLAIDAARGAQREYAAIFSSDLEIAGELTLKGVNSEMRVGALFVRLGQLLMTLVFVGASSAGCATTQPYIDWAVAID